MDAEQACLVREATEPRSSAAGWNWLSFSLRSLAILVTISAAILATFAEQIREYWIGPQLPYKVIQSVDDLNEALSAKRSVIYCDVQWSLDAARGRRVFHDFAIHWRRRMPDTPANFYLLDLTERNDVVAEAVGFWGFSDTQGSGELAWIGDGTPRAFTHHTDDLSHAELAGIAQKAFGLLSVADFPENPESSEQSDLWYWDETIGPPFPGSTVVGPPADNSARQEPPIFDQAMPRNYDDILRDIGSFEPTNGSWLRLDELLTELWAAGVRDDALPTLFGVFERFPHDDGAETFWTLLRGIESLSFDYEQPLRESMSRQPSMMGAVMLGRLERSKG